MIWVQQYGKGRIFNTTLGHGKAAWVNPSLQQLVVRGLDWAVGREPKDP
jgi:type 1 glutamine amidotransferase